MYHPDMNKGFDSSALFIRIREAYDFLLSFYEEQYIDENVAIEEYKAEKEKEVYQEWVRYQRERVRQQAAREARMKYQEFKKTRVYKTALMFNRIANTAIIISGFLIVIGAIYGLHSKGIYEYHLGERSLDYNGILATVLVTVVGLVIIIFTFLNRKLQN